MDKQHYIIGASIIMIVGIIGMFLLFIALNNNSSNSSQNILAEYKKKLDTLPSIVSSVNSTEKFEKEMIIKIAKLRNEVKMIETKVKDNKDVAEDITYINDNSISKQKKG